MEGLKKVNDPYEILGVDRGAGKEEIRRTYRELIKKYHPDKFRSNPDMLKLAEEKTREINEAYTYLMEHIGESDSVNGGSDDQIFAQARQRINTGDLYGAEDLLMKVADKSNPEWYFLNGLIYFQRGWYDKADGYLKQAHQARPENQEYAQAYETLKRYSRAQGPRMYPNGGMGGMAGGGDECMSCCAALACTDLCCHCMGGGC